MKLQIVSVWFVSIFFGANASALNRPTSLKAAVASTSQISLSWSDQSKTESGFIIERSLSQNSGYAEISKVGQNVKSYSNTGLSAATTYYYRVRAYKNRATSVVNSSYSNIVGVKTASAAPEPTPTPTPPPVPTPTPVAGRIYGVTITNPWNQMPAILKSLSSLAFKATSRVVFDEFVPATDYKTMVAQIHQVSHVMGELLDSFYMPKYTVQAYKDRTTEYLNVLGATVDIWEIGNEINGEWLGDTASVVAKMTGAYDIVKAAGKSTALTLYYNQGCWEKADHEMFAWTQNNVPDRMKSGLDYVFISFYEDDCNGIKPDWNAVFQRLGAMFPNSKIGFGENGTVTSSRKEAYINLYYKMQINHPRYVAGNFWWYFDASQNGGAGDMVPQTNRLWNVLNQAMIDATASAPQPPTPLPSKVLFSDDLKSPVSGL